MYNSKNSRNDLLRQLSVCFGESKQLHVETVCPYSVYPTNMVDKIVVWFSFEEEAIAHVRIPSSIEIIGKNMVLVV
jgi:hypothetical protein